MRADHTLEYFLLSYLTIVGGMFGGEMKAFKAVLTDAVKDYYSLFVRLSLASKGRDQLKDFEGTGAMLERLAYESFGTLKRTDQERAKARRELLAGVRTYQRAYYALRRCVEAAWPSLFALSPENYRAFDEALAQLAGETGAAVYRFPMSYYSGREELIGMRVPRNGRSPFVSGILPRLVRKRSRDGRFIW